ncbi:MAG: molecular chaperone DnaJ, partial [Actinomycetales bacterium]
FRAKGKGATTKAGTRGDLLVTVEVQVPTDLDDAQRAAVEALREARGAATPRDGLLEEVPSS